jgi:hypothetical protein
MLEVIYTNYSPLYEINGIHGKKYWNIIMEIRGY